MKDIIFRLIACLNFIGSSYAGINYIINLKVCDPSCLTCNGLTSSDCLSCQSSDFRSLYVSQCICDNGYFDVGVCQSCTQLCASVSLPSTSSCASFMKSDSFIFVGANAGPSQCTCFYDGAYACLACDYTCNGCSSTSKQACSSCTVQTSTQRYFNNYSCLCSDGYYDAGLTVCFCCHYSCLNCSGPSSSDCITCLIGDHRSYHTDQCLCDNNYYESGQGCCATCHYSCSSCTGPSTQCQTCLDINQRSLIANECLCNKLFYDNGQSICASCDYTCLTCSVWSNYCLSCSQVDMRILVDNTCNCQIGSYEDSNSGICQACHYSCLTCQNFGELMCGSCLNLNFRLLEGQDPNKCSCEGGFYDDGSNQKCQGSGYDQNQVCHYSCVTCTSGIESGCNSCDINQNRQLIKGECLCSGGYQTINGSCQIIQETLNKTSTDKQTTKPLCSTINCIGCLQNICSQCSSGYFLKDNYCQKCNRRCKECSGPRISQCTSCKYVTTHNKLCKLYSEVEVVDPVDAPLSQKFKATLRYTSSKSDDNLTLIFNEKVREEKFCQMLMISIKTFSQDQFTFQSKFNDPFSCSVKLIFNASLQDNQQIEVSFEQTIHSQIGQRLDPAIIIASSRRYTYYSAQQQEQAQAVVQYSISFNMSMLMIGCFVILIGGIDIYFRVLDIMTWVNTLYFINVNYPLNIRLFFQYFSWTDFIQIPSIVNLNQPTDSYYQAGPSKFGDKGVSGCFLASLIGDIQFCVAGLIVYIVSVLVCKLLDYIYTQKSAPKKVNLKLFNQLKNDDSRFETNQDDNPQNKNLQLPNFLKPIYKLFKEINDYYATIFMKFLLLVLLDFQTASILQIQAGQYLRHPLITTNLVMAWMVQIGSIYLPIYFYQIVNKSPLLMDLESYEMKYGSLYENIRINTRKGKVYCIFQAVKKSLFVYFLTLSYYSPLFQTINCALVCSINIILISFYNPFQDKISLIRNLIPEIAIFGSLATAILFAIDDQIQILSDDQKFNLGWFLLSLIAVSIATLLIFLIARICAIYKQRIIDLVNLLIKKK